VLAGAVQGGTAEPAELVVALNGRIAGVVGGYRRRGDEWAFTGYVADFFAVGRNEVRLFEVTREGREATLHPVR
jgi:hypothetical protein